MMITMVIERCWWWTKCDKHILHMCICWSYYVNSTKLLTHRYWTYRDQQSILAIKYIDQFGWCDLYNFNVGHNKQSNKMMCIVYKTLLTIKYTKNSVCFLLGLIGTGTTLSSSSGRSLYRKVWQWGELPLIKAPDKQTYCFIWSLFVHSFQAF
jgi:hypothetical protein